MNLRDAIVNILAGSSLLAVASAAQSQTPPSGGDAATRQQSSTLEEIVVTAQRKEERLQDVPISITVFNQEQLSNNNVTNAVDLANLTPSLSVNNNFGNENASFAIRGFVQDPGTPPSVGVYFADVVAPRGPTQGTQAGDSLGPGAFFDLQNLQVLKGPQGTLFGRNTTGGAILLVPQKPTGNFEGYAEASGGNFDMLRYQLVVNAPLGEAVRFRVGIDHEKRSGWLNNISGLGPDAYNDVSYTAARASLVIDVTNNIENYTIGSYSKSDTNGSVQKLIAASALGSNPAPPAPPAGLASPIFAQGLGNFFGVFSYAQLQNEAARGAGFYDVQAPMPNPESLVEQWQIINTTTVHASDTLTVKNIASYARYKDFQRSPLFGVNWQLSQLPAAYQFAFGIGGGVPQLFTTITPAPGRNTADQSTYTEELQIQGLALNSALTYQAGVYLEWSDPRNPVGNQSNQLINCSNLAALICADQLGTTFTSLTAGGLAARGVPPPYPQTHVGSVNYTVGETTYRDQGIYAQSTYSFTEQFKLTAGARYTSDKQTNNATRITYNYPVTTPLPAPSAPSITSCTDPATVTNGCAAAYEQKSSKPTWMLNFEFTPVKDLLLYAKYARGYRAGGVFTNAPADHRTFEPEKVDNFELGLKTAWQGAVPGGFNLAAFYNNLSSQQLQIGYFAAPGAPVSPTTAIVNAGKSRIYGLEAEFSITPVQGLNFDLNYTYLNTEIREIGSTATTDPNYVSGVFITPGLPLALSPKNKAVASLKYTLPLDKRIGDIFVGMTYTYTDKQLSNYNYFAAGTTALLGSDHTYLDSRGLLNANLGWNSIAGTGLDVVLFATNVTNKQYYQYIPGLASVQTGLEFATIGEPRMYGARLRYRFGP